MSTCSRHPTENVRKIYKWYDNGSYASTECLTNVMRCMMENDVAALEEYVDFLRADPKAAARINERSSSGLTALSYCARAGCADMVRLLLTVPGVDVILVDNNYRHNALMWAAKGGHDECVDILMPYTDLKYKDVLGRDAAKLAKHRKMKIKINTCKRLQ